MKNNKFFYKISDSIITKEIIDHAIKLFFTQHLKDFSDHTYFKTQLIILTIKNEVITLTPEQTHNNSSKDLTKLINSFYKSLEILEKFLNKNLKGEFLIINFEKIDSYLVSKSNFNVMNPDIIDNLLENFKVKTKKLEINKNYVLNFEILPILINKETFSKILKLFFKIKLSLLPNDLYINTQLAAIVDKEIKIISCVQIHKNNEFDKLFDVL